MFPLMLTILHRDHSTPLLLIRSKDCQYKGEDFKLRVYGEVCMAGQANDNAGVAAANQIVGFFEKGALQREADRPVHAQADLPGATQ